MTNPKQACDRCGPAFPEKRVHSVPTGKEQMAPEMQVGNSHFMKKIEHILEN